MNILLWVLQVALAMFCLSGGSFKVFKFDELAKVPSTAALPRAGWAVLGIFEMVCGVLLIVPGAVGLVPALTALAAAALTLESLGLSALFARYSLKFVATNPLVWAAGMGLVAAFVAYGRYVLSPLG